VRRRRRRAQCSLVWSILGSSSCSPKIFIRPPALVGKRASASPQRADPAAHGAQLEGWRSIRSGRHTPESLRPPARGKPLPPSHFDRPACCARASRQGNCRTRWRVIYVSPLKALFRRYPQEPRRAAARDAAHRRGRWLTARWYHRLGEERGTRLKASAPPCCAPPPHILVTTPESLYLLLTAERSRQMLKTARVVIVDEIHAVLESRRGAHLALSLERLDHVCGRRLQRVGCRDSEADRGCRTVPLSARGSRTAHR